MLKNKYTTKYAPSGENSRGETMYDTGKIRLFKELVNYEKHGVSLWMDECPSSPVDIVNSEVLQEEAVYMRDYIANEKGVLIEIHFNRISG